MQNLTFKIYFFLQHSDNDTHKYSRDVEANVHSLIGGFHTVQSSNAVYKEWSPQDNNETRKASQVTCHIVSRHIVQLLMFPR